MSAKSKKPKLPKRRNPYALHAMKRSGGGVHRSKREEHVCDFSDVCNGIGEIFCECGKQAACDSCVACNLHDEEADYKYDDRD